MSKEKEISPGYYKPDRTEEERRKSYNITKDFLEKLKKNIGSASLKEEIDKIAGKRLEA